MLSRFAELRQRIGVCRAAAGFALRVVLNIARSHIAQWLQNAFGEHRREIPEPPEIQRLMHAMGAADECVELETPGEMAVGRSDVIADILSLCPIIVVGRCAAVSKDFHKGALRDDLWRKLCFQRWRNRQHSVHIRRWMAALHATPKPEDLLAEYASEEQMLQCRAAAQECKGASTPKWCRVASWRDRFVFAERDAKRTNISLEELCWDSPFAELDLLDAEDGLQEDDADAAKHFRRWAMTLHFTHSFDIESFFYADGTYSDTGRFAYGVPWHFVHGPHGQVMIQLSPPSMDIPPLAAKRMPDWGWRLVVTGRLKDMVQLYSRQLSLTSHRLAEQTPSEIITVFMQRCSAPDHHNSVFGSWRCFQGFQGMMPAPSWDGRQITIDRETLTMSIQLSSSIQLTCRCHIDEIGRTLDITERSDLDEDLNEGMNVERGVYYLESDGDVLVHIRNEIRGGPRPTGPPAGLPSIEEILRSEGMSARPGVDTKNRTAGAQPEAMFCAPSGTELIHM